MLVLVHPGEYILPEIGEKLGRYADKKLRERGVEFRKDESHRVTPQEIELSDGERSLASPWSGPRARPNPTRARPLRERTRPYQGECQSGSGRAAPALWAVGDCALIPDPRTGQILSADRATCIARRESFGAQHHRERCAAKKKRPFSFKIIGLLAAIGRRTGVARIFGDQLFRISRLVSLARDLLEQTAANGEENSCRDRLGARCLLHEGFCPVSRPALAGNFCRLGSMRISMRRA